MKKIILVSFLLVTASLGYGQQQMYQWRDSQGKVHYTDNAIEANQKRASVIEKEDLTKINTMPSQSTGEDLSQRRQQEAYMRQQQKEVAEHQQKVREQCQRAYNYLQGIKKDPPRMVTINDDGSRHYYSDEEINAYIREQEANYRKNCGNF